MVDTAAARALNDGQERLVALDGLRGLAILLVMVFHLVLQYPFAASAGSLYYQLGGIGWIGVDLFFVLSGFLITGILIDTKESPNFFSAFFVRRALRIFPLYYAALIVIFLIAPRFGVYDTPELRFVLDRQIYFWTYMTNWGFVEARGARFFNVDWLALVHFWSLAVEEQFYVAWPFVVYLFSRRGLVRICVLLVVGALAFRLTIVGLGLPQGAAYTLTPARIDTLAVGALLAIASRTEGVLFHLQKAATWCGAGALIFLIFVFFNHQGVWFADRWMHTIGFSVLAVGWGAMLATCLSGGPYPAVRLVFEARWLRAFGKYSYGLYVLHHLMLPFLPATPFVRLFPEPLGATFYIICSIALFLAAAWLSWVFIENPFLRLKCFFGYQSAPGVQPSGVTA
ncbi:acyltransferase family protein [Hansschlegelia quercus]|uniref:Acyltransferase n=1 Tax=Hansschlegelia quercus TaxID=2528245 RepID=A0A4Q9GG02_9HYPH|nr:acyltransferase [Hansschlegelia quercus]TBN47301.1 acyltransferase [Hansschlegelia quercus]